MKNKILLILAVIGVVALCVLSVREYQRHQSDKLAAQKVQASQHQAAVDAEAKRAAAEEAEKVRLHDSCLSGQKAYEALPTSSKVKITAPNCSLQQVQ